jgi:hypothetical protein
MWKKFWLRKRVAGSEYHLNPQPPRHHHGRPGSTAPFDNGRLNSVRAETESSPLPIAHHTTPKRSVMPHRSYFNLRFVRGRLCEHAGAASLDGFHLSLGPGETTETRGELSAVEELAGLGLDGAKRCARVAADGAVEGSAAERTVLLSLRAVGSEGVWKSSSGRGGVSARSVVNRLWRQNVSSGFGFRGYSSTPAEVHILGMERFPTKRMRGVRAAAERAEVTRIVKVGY